MKVFKRSVWVLISVFLILLFIVLMAAQPIMMQSEGWINNYLGINPYEVKLDKDDDSDSEYFKSKFVKKDAAGNVEYITDENGYKHQAYDHEAMRKYSHKVSNRVATEGAVLLWNNTAKDGAPALPLAKDDSVGIFSTLALPAVRRDDGFYYHGGGSGRVYQTFNKSIKEAFEKENFKVNEKLWTAYSDIKASDDTYWTWGFPRGLYDESGTTNLDNDYREAWHHEIPFSELDKKINASVDLRGDTAVMIISRYNGENCDTDFYSEDSLENNYLDLYNAEVENLNRLAVLKKDGVIKKVIVLLNTGTAMAMKNLTKFDIDACMWIGYGGDNCFDSMAQLLSGKVNPCGRLADTYAYDVTSAPAMENFGDMTFTEYAGVPEAPNNRGYRPHNTKFLVYSEGIYVGYRYYETRYEDTVMNKGNATSPKGVKMGESQWNYSSEVAYPFGYGLSYTSFEYSGFDVKKSGDEYEVSVKVTNTGKAAGREVVQIYLQKPYTQYDVENRIEKSSVELVGFAKTGLIDIGGEETVTVTVAAEEFKCYDAYNKGTYILEKGDYYIAVGYDAHDALNNILAEKGYSVSNGMDSDGNRALCEKVHVSRDDFNKYAKSSYTGEEIKNQFNDADATLYSETKNQGVKYLTRSDWNATYPTPAVLTCNTAQMVSDMQYGGKTVVGGKLTVDYGGTVPQYGTVTSEYGKLTLAMLIGLDYDNPLWEDLLNQLTFEEQCTLITYGSMAIAGAPSVAAPGYKSADGPQGVKVGNTNLPEDGYRQKAFASSMLLAATFDLPLAREYGEAFGYEMLHVGVTGIYGTGVNLHRTAHSGRNWEYMSEDPFLSGKIYAMESLGLTGTGAVMFTKHFALNDSERNRYGVTTWASEQTIRELYLKAFEIGITEGKTNGLMSSFNRLGTTWTGAHRGLLTEVLRNEWGFIGVCETDASVSQHMFMPDPLVAGIIAGQDVWMDGGPEAFDADALTRWADNPTVCNAMREAAKRNLYVMANSSAMNGIGRGAEIIYHMPWWQNAMLAGQIVTGILAGISVAMAVASFVLARKKER